MTVVLLYFFMEGVLSLKTPLAMLVEIFLFVFTLVCFLFCSRRILTIPSPFPYERSQSYYEGNFISEECVEV